MKSQYKSVSEEDFDFLYKKDTPVESLFIDYIGILFSIFMLILGFSFFDFNFLSYFEFNNILHLHYL